AHIVTTDFNPWEICPEPTALDGFAIVFRGWNKFHPYNMIRAYGSCTSMSDILNEISMDQSYRDLKSLKYNLTAQPELFADRGFTGHEWLKYFNLYNMNGRMYDPLVGRFLSADNVIQDPTNAQNYNRYSYCLNNPLKYYSGSSQYSDLSR
ncbi:MAG TPA: RHS repeat-associated core domain-containing protein, partial [Prolixibacteraceae bacterium]